MLEFGDLKFKGKDNNSTDIKGGIKRESITDSTLLNIFDKVDNNPKDGILDSQEINVFQQKVIEEAAKRGRDSKLSSKEAENYLQSIGVTGDSSNLFSFINKLSKESENIKNSQTLADGTIVTEYKDGTKESIQKDGTKIIQKGTTTTKYKQNENGEYEIFEETFVDPKDGSETVTKFENGKKTSTMKTYPNGTKEEITYNEDGTKPTKSVKTDSNGDVESITYDSDGNQTAKTVIKDKGQTEEEYSYEDGKLVLKSKVVGKGTDKEVTTMYGYNSDGTTTETIFDKNNNKQVLIKKGNEIIQESRENSDGSTYTKIINNGKTIETTYQNSKKTSQVITQDTNTYSVEYDGNGNTKGVTVENGESIAIIAKKFGCSVADLIAANKANVKGTAPNQYFLVGSDIVIPGEIDADKFAELTAGRQSKEEAIDAYKVTAAEIESAKNEVEARKNNKRTFIEQKYNTFRELAVGAFAREGVTNPTQRQINLRIQELKELNPNLKDGELIGKRVIVTFNDATDSSIGVGQQKREQARIDAKNKQEAKEGKTLAQTMYDALDDHWGGVSEKDFQASLNKINSNNVVGVLKQYKTISPDESIIEAIFDETANSLETRKNAVEKIIKSLEQRVKQANITDDRAKQAVTSCMNELNSYWSMGIGYCQTSKLDGLINNLMGAIDAAEALTHEEKTRSKSNGISETIDLMNNQVSANTDALNKQLAEDGWCADLYEGLKWCVGSDNLDENVKADLQQYQKFIGELQKAEKEGGEAGFKAKFKEIFGVEYDANLMKGYNKLQSNYAMATGLAYQKDGFYNEFSNAINGKENYATMRNKYGEYLVNVSNNEIKDKNNAVDVAIKTELEKKGIKFENATDAQKAEALRNIIKNTYNGISQEYDKYTNGQSLSEIKKQLDNAGSAVFGNKHDIAFRVNDYISSQQQGGAAVNMAVKAVGAIAIGVATGGTGLAALATASVATAVVSATVDLSDRVSSDVGLKDGEIVTILKNAAVDGASVFAGGQIGKYAAMFKSANAFTQAGGRLVMQVAGDVATGVAAEYVQTGEITLEGVAFQAIFSAAGNLISLKQLAKTNDSPNPSVLDNATSNNSSAPGGKLGDKKFNEVKRQTVEEVPNATPERVGKIHSEADKLQSVSREQGKQVKHIVEDGVGIVDSPTLGRVDIAAETDLSKLAKLKEEVNKWSDTARNKKEILEKISQQEEKIKSGQRINNQSNNLNVINSNTADDAAKILAKESGALSPHGAAILDDHIMNNVKTVEELENIKKQLESRVGYQVQGVDHAQQTIKKIETRIKNIKVKQAEFSNVKDALEAKISAKKGLSEQDVQMVNEFIKKCDTTEDLDNLLSLLKNKNIKKSGMLSNLINVAENKKTKLSSQSVEVRNQNNPNLEEKPVVESKPKIEQKPEPKPQSVEQNSVDYSKKIDEFKTQEELDAYRKTLSPEEQVKFDKAYMDKLQSNNVNSVDNVDNIKPDISLKNSLGSSLYAIYESVIDKINNLKTIVDYVTIKNKIETAFASTKDVMDSLLEKLNLKSKSINLDTANPPKIVKPQNDIFPDEINFDRLKMSDRVLEQSGRTHLKGKSMGELLSPEQKKVYTDSYEEFLASKDLKILHNATNSITENNLLHSTRLEYLLSDGGILDNGLAPRELTGKASARNSSGIPDTMTPLCTDVWDVRGNTSIQGYFDPNKPHWVNGHGESNFMSPNYNDGSHLQPIVVVLDKNSMSSKLIENSFNVNNSGRSILFDNGNMSRGHNYPNHRAIPIGAPSNSIEKIIIDPRWYGDTNIQKLKNKISENGLDIKLFDYNGNQL